MLFFTQSYFIPLTVDDDYVENHGDVSSRIYAQYRNKSKAVRWYEIVKTLATGIASAADYMRVSYDINSATGEQLDILGRIVVVPRDYLGYVALNPGLFSEPDGAEFGDVNAMFSALSIDQDSQMSDDFYRLVIKSKIIKNNSGATIEDVLRNINFLLPNAKVLRVVDNEDMSFSVEFYGNITELERWALLNANLIPKPQGVKFNGFLEALGYVQFGDDSKEFGDITTQFIGFIGV